MMTSEWMKKILYLENNTKRNNLEKLNKDEVNNLYQQLQVKKRDCQIK